MSIDVYQLASCPACGTSSAQAVSLFTISLLEQQCSVLRCPHCTLVYKGLMPTTNGLKKIYTESYVHFQDNLDTIDRASFFSSKQKIKRCRALLKKSCPNEEIKLLDIGCASGGFVNISQKMGYMAEGIDPYLPPQLQSQSLQLKSPEDVLTSSYDMAFLLNVAEHLDRPKQLFTEIHRLLKPNGVMLLTCPYGNSLARKIHQDRWGHLILDEHLLFWTPLSLTLLLREIGFQGKVSYRIAGSPFPYGRVRKQAEEVLFEQPEIQDLSSPSAINHKQISVQARVWQVARTIQRQESVANIVRSLIHFTHTGDYLEYAIAIN